MSFPTVLLGGPSDLSDAGLSSAGYAHSHHEHPSSLSIPGLQGNFRVKFRDEEPGSVIKTPESGSHHLITTKPEARYLDSGPSSAKGEIVMPISEEHL